MDKRFARKDNPQIARYLDPAVLRVCISVLTLVARRQVPSC